MILKLVARAVGCLVIASWATPTIAAPTIQTQQSRILDGVAGATWGPVVLKATGGAEPYVWTHVGGAWPAGLALASSGLIEGSTTTAGVYEFTMRVTDAVGATAQRAYRVRVHPPTVVRPPALDASRLPFGYVQSAFELGGNQGPTRSVDELKALIRFFQTHFPGGETFLGRLEEPEDFAHVRRFNQAIAERRNEAGNPDFVALFSNGRLPDFFFPADLDGQPDEWRAQSLKSNGETWVRRPQLEGQNGSIFGLHAAHVDIANDEAVDALMTRLSQVYDHEGPAGDSVGPLNGFLMLNEAKATPLYLPFLQLGRPEDPDLDDLQPRQSMRAACAHDWNERADAPPILRAGDPCVLYSDGSPQFSYFIGPKRALPMFSEFARDKFVAYALDRLMVIDKLPADRAEFNHDNATVALPSHVRFVGFETEVDKAIWSMWESWVYDTWFGYLERMSRTIRFAQAGNPHFRGVLHFQLPGWYSFRAPAKNEQIPYKYRDVNDTLQTVSNQHLVDFSGFETFNDVTHGTDIEQFVRSPWVQGFLHETTTPVMGAGTSDISRDGDRAVLTSLRGVYLWNQEGAAARLVTRRNQKFFGLFARYYYFGVGPLGDRKQLQPDDWKWNWDGIVPLNPPDFVATLPPQHYLSPSDMEADYRYLVPPYYSTGANGDSWLDRFRALRSIHTRPAAWNPRSLGSIGTFNGRNVGGWAFDPWSTRTSLTAHLLASPNNCYSGPAQIATFFADNPTSTADDTAIRNTIRTAANYAPPEAMNFRYGTDLVAALQGANAICGPGNYTLQVRVEDGQGDALDQVLSYQGSSTLTVPVVSPSVRVATLQPQPFTASLAIAGTASGAPAGSPVRVTWRDNSVSGPFTSISLEPVPGPSGDWFSSIPNADPTHLYEVYAAYGGVTSAHCTYRGDGAVTSCGSGATLSLIAARSGAGSGTVTSAPAGINCGTDCTQVYAGGTSVTLTPAPAAGSVFVAWDGPADCFDGQVTLSGSARCTARFETTGTAQARVIWQQPQAMAGFGSPGSLVMAGSATGAPAGARVTMSWRDVTIGGAWTTEAYQPLPNGSGVWYHSIPYANYGHRYQVYVTYGNTTSASCTYAGNGGVTTCP